MIKKYKLTDATLVWKGHTLHRIEAITEFGCIGVGDLGGWVESEDNLSHWDNCWIYNDAKVYGKACVRDEAKIFDNAEVYDNACVNGNALVYDKAKIYEFSEIREKSRVCGEAQVYGSAVIGGYAMVCGNSKVHNADILNDAKISGNAEVYGAVVDGKADISHNAVVTKKDDYIVFRDFWGTAQYFTWTRSNNLWKLETFYGTGDELVKKAYEDSEECGKNYEKVVNYVKEILEEEKSQNL